MALADLQAKLRNPAAPQLDRVVAAIGIVEAGLNRFGPGGADDTNYGIEQALLDKWQAAAGLPTFDVAALTWPTAQAIYKEWFYDPCRGGELPFGPALLLTDMAVQHGQDRAVRVAQRAYDLREDGKVGLPGSAKRLTIDTLCTQPLWRLDAARAHHYTTLAKYPQFGSGWQNRRARITAIALLGKDL